MYKGGGDKVHLYQRQTYIYNLHLLVNGASFVKP